MAVKKYTSAVREVIEYEWVCKVCNIRSPHLFSDREAAQQSLRVHRLSELHERDGMSP